MKSPDIGPRRHRPHRSKANSRRRSTAHISPAYATEHVTARPGRSKLAHSTTVIDGNKEDMVRGWLDEIQAHRPEAAEEVRRESKRATSRQATRRSSPSPVRWAPHGLHPSEGLGIAQSFVRPRGESRHKRRRASLDDSSVIVTRRNRKAPILFDDDVPTRRTRSSSVAEESYHERGKGGCQPQADADESGESLALFVPNHNFEKRARHKTKSDRYDSVKNTDNRKEKKKKKSEKKGVGVSKKARKTRDQMTSAREVMDNFTSHSILSERITMPPSLQPGLFDNGRVSKNHIPDLTFHQMSFLKLPRREPQQPQSRRREVENRRGEREREDISAFFLNKGLPDRYDAQGRTQHEVSGLSSRDGRTGDRSSNGHERRHAISGRRLVPQPHNPPAKASDQTPPRAGAQSMASTYISWSSSRPSARLRIRSLSDTRALSSTPVHVRDALARTGIFDNTGIQFAGRLANEQSLPDLSTQAGLASARPVSVIPPSDQEAQCDIDQPVRIVRYQDRGTMAGEKSTRSGCAATHLKGASTQTDSANLQARFSDSMSVQHPEDRAETKAPECEALDGPDQMNDTTNMKLHHTRTTETGICEIEDFPCLETGPERPKAPKWAFIERLEALAEYERPHCSSAASPTPDQMDHQRTWAAHEIPFTIPSSAGRVPARSWHHSRTLKLDPNTLAPRPGYTPIQADFVSLYPSRSYHLTYSESVPSTVVMPLGRSRPQCAPIVNSCDHVMSDLSYSPQSHITPAQDSTHGVQRSMQEYIADIERDAWDAPEQDESSRMSPLMEPPTMWDATRSGLGGDDDHESAHLQDNLTRMSRPLARVDTSPLKRVAVVDWEQEDEQRFMSSFWRPNGYRM